MSARDSFRNTPFASSLAEVKRALKRQRQAARTRRLDRGASPPAAESAPTREEPGADLFRRAMADVTPLAGEDRIPARAAEPPPAAPQDDEAEAMAQLADLVEGREQFDFTGSDEYIEGTIQGLDRRLLKKLRQGTFAVQAHLDLHGKTRAEAREIVERFLLDSRYRSRRCVLLVHGRGLNSKDQVPVLKESLKVWLAKGRIAKSVLAFCSARPVDGGAGAVYVLLRR